MSSEGGLEDFSSDRPVPVRGGNAFGSAQRRAPGSREVAGRHVAHRRDDAGGTLDQGGGPRGRRRPGRERRPRDGGLLRRGPEGALTLSPGDVDVLLRGVDLLGKISEATRDPKADLANDFDETVKSLVVELEAMLVPRGQPRGGPRVASIGPRSIGVEAPGSNAVAPAAERPRRRSPARRRSRSRNSSIRRPRRRSADSISPRSSAVATRSGSTCGRRRTWTSRGWRSWPRSLGTPPSTAARVSSWRGCPRRWKRCST